jgi:hypothetical protein
MTGEAYIAATPPVSAPPSREVVPAAAAASRADPEPKPVAPATPSASTTLPPSFPVSLQFDQETHRFFIEARDSSGLVVFQVPFKAAVAASAGTSSSSGARGQRVNSKA